MAADLLDALDPVVVGGVMFLVDRSRPVAALRGVDGLATVVVWPDAPLPARSASPSVLAAPGCVWVVYAEDSTDPARTSAATAVRIGVDGQVSACELGSLEAIGADEHGVWLADFPYLQLEEGLYDDEESDAGGPAALGPPEELSSAPVESWEDFERAQRQATKAETEQYFATFPSQSKEGETSGWFTYSPLQADEPEQPLPAPPPPSPSGPAVLHRVRVDGGREQMRVSRVVTRVQAEAPERLTLVFHPTGVMLTADPNWHGYVVHYPRRATKIDVSAGLPAVLDLDALPSQPLDDEDEEQGEDEWEDQGGEGVGQDVDLGGVAGTRWSLRPISPDEVEAAVRSVRAQYAGLDQTHLVHTPRDDRWHRVQSKYADVEVRTEEAWPETEVVVDFTYLPNRDHRLRRRTRVFDHVGAPIGARYLSVYLEEDLATTDLTGLPVVEGRSQI